MPVQSTVALRNISGAADEEKEVRWAPKANLWDKPSAAPCSELWDATKRPPRCMGGVTHAERAGISAEVNAETLMMMAESKVSNLFSSWQIWVSPGMM